MTRGRMLVVAVAAVAMAAVGCQDNLEAPLEQPALDRPYFDCKVQPVLTKYCSALACHGDAARYYRIFARNRHRLVDAEMQRNAFMTIEERDHNYAATLATVNALSPETSELLLKPLAEAGGGWYHEGAELYKGGDVFASTDDPDYKVIADWIGGATEMPTCQEPGSNL